LSKFTEAQEFDLEADRLIKFSDKLAKV